nr:MAG TPA: hypothetical protein [Caudoviricetes sp.]
MSGVKKSFWLDAPRREEAQSGSIPGTVVGAGENGTVRVAVGGAENVVNVPSGGGVFERGSEVRVQVDASGVPTGLQDAGVSVTEGGLVYAGAEGRRLREVAVTADAAKAAWDRAQRELEAARGQTERDLASLRDTLQGAQADAQNARLMFSTSEKDPKSYFRDINATPPVGAVYEQRGQGGAVENRFRWDGQNWVEFNIASSSVRVDQDLWTRMLHVAGDGTITGNLIAGGSVTADKIVASKELSAKVAKFEESVVSKLRAEKAVITGDLIADNLTGKIIDGGTVIVKTAGSKGSHLLRLMPVPDTGEAVIAFNSLEGGTYRNKASMSANGISVYSGVPGERPTFMSWLDMGAAPYYRYASGQVNIALKRTLEKVALRADTSARGKQVRVVGGNSLIVPRAGRYRVTGWACAAVHAWDTVVEVALLRGNAIDAAWGDLYSYATAPDTRYATPSFSGLVDFQNGERIALGVNSTAAAELNDYRLELEFITPL